MKNPIARRQLITLGSAGFGGLLAMMAQRANAQSHAEEATVDRASIVNVVNGIAIFADIRDWQRCRQSFTDMVEFDYTSLIGGQPTTLSADQQIQQWEAFFANTFKTTQHILGSHVVTVAGNTATCLSNFQAHHTYLDTNKGTWVLSGYYDHRLVKDRNGWKVNRMKMTWTWEDGTRPF